MGRTEIEAFSQNRSYTGVSNSNRPTHNIGKMSEEEYDRKKYEELLKLEKEDDLDDNMKPYLKFLRNKFDPFGNYG